ncbi:MAG TPA: DUF4198 domain-containing protein [Afifellaceae bacterium]|nr:DUF4198 domain-containing protein [Afifellaceae bacterium]
MVRHGAIGLLLALICTTASAHEFWVEPESFRVAPGERVRAELKVGQDFKGNVFPYLRDRFVAYRVTGRAGASEVSSYDGASPSLDIKSADAGLTIVSYHSTADRLIYRDWETFLKYTDYEGLTRAVAEHRARGLPERDFSETYVRCAKALIQVGPVGEDDRDRPVGMPLELVALANPYAGPLPGGLPVRLLWQGAPMADTQVAVFRQSGGNLNRTVTRTGADGVATVPLEGGGRFLLNAVRLDPADPNTGDEWHSHWASLTFAVADE